MPLDPIQVDPGGHTLVTQSGQPFFWLADTAWELFHRLNRSETEYYLETRRQQGFNVIQAVILAELDGLHTPNANAHTPLLGDDPTRLNAFYFRHVDETIQMAAEKGLYVGLLPTWGDKVHADLWGVGPVIFNPENARVYGKLLGQRYKNYSNILWILGGDRPAAGYETLWASMAEGITEGIGKKPFFTYHPWGGVSKLDEDWLGGSSSAWLQEAEWLDMHMLQSGHALIDAPNWEMITADYQLSHPKPVLDGEPNYEGHPIDPFRRRWTPKEGRFTDYDVRKQAYRAVFSGACGHTYGHHSIWQFWTFDREPINFPMPTWHEALYAPGASQLIHLKNLMLSRSSVAFIPDQSLLVEDVDAAPINHSKHYDPSRAAVVRAIRAIDRSFAMIYTPLPGRAMKIDLSRLEGRFSARWFDPRSGRDYFAGEFPNEIVTIPAPIAGPDWVLLLDG